MSPRKRKEPKRSGQQLVLRVPAEVKALLQKTAADLKVSMNVAATARIATGKWPQRRTA